MMDMNLNEINSKINQKNVVPNLPENDKRQYKVITLDNELRITIISDITTDKSAVALDVRVGAMSDPTDILGLAHFCEHMVFMGSKKYPEENYYAQYLSKNNGIYNAYTSYDHTNFYLQIKPDNLIEALDIFAQFFIEPLFTESATDRELEAVNSEFEKNLIFDYRRLSQLDRHLADPNHDYHKFSTGNLKTLRSDPLEKGINVRDALLAFHDQYYSSNIMSLCVLGKESLDVLEKTVVDMFSAVPNKNTPLPFWPTQPWCDSHLQKMVYLESVKEAYELSILWPIPNYFKLYRSKPEYYVSNLLAHEDEGSILYLLKKRKWAQTLLVSVDNKGTSFANIIMNISLFEEGLEHINEIITIVYHYIHMLKSNEPELWIFEELQKLKSTDFRFKENGDMQGYVSSLSANMHCYDIEHFVQGPYIFEEFRPDLIKSIQDRLVPSNMKVYCASKLFSDKWTDVEPWYNTSYGQYDISNEDAEKWQMVEPIPELHLPRPNLFIADNFNIKSKLSSDESTPPLPQLIRDNAFGRWWFNLDREYLLPKGYVYISVVSNLSAIDPAYIMMNKMLVNLFGHYIDDFIYSASLANLSVNFNPIEDGFQVMFYGYNDKMSEFINTIFKELVKFKPNAETFESIKMALFRQYRNFELDKPLYQADHFLKYLTNDSRWTKNDCLSTINDITLENFTTFFKTFFSRCYTEGLIYGNFNQTDSETIIDSFYQCMSSTFDVRPLLSSQLIVSREILLPEDNEYVYHLPNDKQTTSAIICYFQGLPQSPRNDVITQFVNFIISEPLFNTLRTKEQLGYIVHSNIKSSNSYLGHQILLQSMKRPDYLNERVDLFLTSFLETLKSMTDETFKNYVNSLKHQITERPKNMSQKFRKLWNEIRIKHYNFVRVEEEVLELSQLTKQDVVEYYQKVMTPGSKNLKKLSVFLTATKTFGDDFENKTLDPRINIIDDMVKFKKSLPLSPSFQPNLTKAKGYQIPLAKL